jgi:hypothetical protein
MQYDNTNSGTLFRNDKKETEKHPDYKGSINIEGREYWLSGWLNQSKNGQKYQKLSATPKDAQKEQAPQQQDNFQDQDIPF